VTPVHGRKAAARLAELGHPYYYYENMEGGHAAAANLPETARRWRWNMSTRASGW
jgi:prolyl oligopeptidase